MNLIPSFLRHKAFLVLAAATVGTAFSGCLIEEERHHSRRSSHHRAGHYDHREPYGDHYHDRDYRSRVNRYENSRYRNTSDSRDYYRDRSSRSGYYSR